jgi:transcriptional regulator with XRE-family HTH domain
VVQDYAHAVGALLRDVRARRGLTLHAVEDKSSGRWKAVVVGSYERGDRAITVARLAELADFYGIRIQELLPDTSGFHLTDTDPRLVVDLQLLSALPPEQVGPLARYAATIQSQRGKFNDRVLTIRGQDLRSLAVLYDLPPDTLVDRLICWGVLAAGSPDVEERHQPTYRASGTRPGK